MIIKLSPIEDTFGMPPSTHVSDAAMVNSMPVMEITPGTPSFASGLTLFTVNDAWDQYEGILKNHGFTLSSKPIRLAFIADNFPTDSFTNEYGETFLQKFTDVASQGMQQLAQITGARTGSQAAKNLATTLQNMGTSVGGTVGGIMETAGSSAVNIMGELGKLKTQLGQEGGMLRGGLDIVNKTLGGYRIDFPQIWRNSGFTPSYTATIRLYNPNPGSPTQTIRHIIGPLAVILCLAIPRSDNGKSFNWPFFHKIKSQGIYNLNPAVITNITVIKGGDQQQISHNQRLGMVDIRIDFTSLYGSMVLEEGKSMNLNRPTVKNYLASLAEKESEKKIYYTRDQMRDICKSQAAASDTSQNSVSLSSPSTNVSDQNLLARNEAARRRKPTTVEDKVVSSRIYTADYTRTDNLINAGPTGLYTTT